MAPLLFSPRGAGRAPDRRVQRRPHAARFTHVSDIVRGILGALAHPGEAGPHRVFNLGNHTPVELERFIA
jgi:UDP-glucuronate 4-epimerase